MWSRRDFLGRLGATAVVGAGLTGEALPAACGGPQAARSSSVAPVKGGFVVEGTTTDFVTLSPLRALQNDLIIVSALYDGLLTNNAVGDLMPAVATSLPEASADGLTYTFNLRKDLNWSDGRPLNADDVVFTYRLMYDTAYKDVVSLFRGDLESHLLSITALDPYRVIFKLKTPYVPFVGLHCTYGILPQHVLGTLSGKEINTHEFNTAPSVVNGVFKFVEWKRGDHLTVARNDSYYRGAALLDKCVFQLTSSDPSKIALMKTGDVHVGKIVSTSLVADVKASPQLEVFSFTVPTVLRYLYQLDPAKPASKFFASKAVRQALYVAVDRKGIADTVWANSLGATAATSEWPPVSWAYSNNVNPKYAFDPKKANAMLDAEGWKRNSSGIREKDNVPMRFEVATSSQSVEYTNVATILQQNWKDIGVDAQVKGMAYAGLTNLVTTQRSFDVIIYALLLGLDPDASAFWHSRNAVTGGQNGMPFKNQQVDQLLDEGAATADRGKRKTIYGKVQDILADELPAPPLVAQRGFWAYNKSVHNLDANTIGAYSYVGNRPFMKDVFITPK